MSVPCSPLMSIASMRATSTPCGTCWRTRCASISSPGRASRVARKSATTTAITRGSGIGALRWGRSMAASPRSPSIRKTLALPRSISCCCDGTAASSWISGISDMPATRSRAPNSRRLRETDLAGDALLSAIRNERAQAVVAQVQAAPKHDPEVDGKEHVTANWIADAQMRCDRPTEITGQQDRAQYRGPRVGVKRRTDETQNAEAASKFDAGRVPELRGRRDDDIERNELDASVKQHERDDQAA